MVQLIEPLESFFSISPVIFIYSTNCCFGATKASSIACAYPDSDKILHVNILSIGSTANVNLPGFKITHCDESRLLRQSKSSDLGERYQNVFEIDPSHDNPKIKHILE
jgi:hypothetical protein